MPILENGLPSDIQDALHQVRNLFRAVIDAVCGSGARAKDVSDRFGLHAKLGWQIWNVAYAEPLSTFRFLPNEHGLQLWKAAASQRGVPTELLDQLQAAVDRTRGVVEVHADDREMFEMLLDAQAPSASEDAVLRWRRGAFLGNSFTFGVRAKCLFASAIFFPAPGHRFSIARILGQVGLVRTRPGVRWPISSLVVQQVDRTPTRPRSEPLFPSGSSVPLIPDFCSQPLPEVARTDDGQVLRDELAPGVVGQTGAVTLFTGEVLHDVAPSHGAVGGEPAHFGTGVRTPAEMLIADHLIHRSLFAGSQPELRVFSELVSSTTRDPRDLIQVPEGVDRLGQGLLRVGTPEFPSYRELLGATFGRLGLDAGEFEVYRVRMRYPPLPASVMLRHTLPPPPASVEPHKENS